jgi:hypothetical protein
MYINVALPLPSNGNLSYVRHSLAHSHMELSPS